MAGSQLPVIVHAPVLPQESAGVAKETFRQREFRPALRTLAATAAELAPDFIRLARRARVRRSRRESSIPNRDGVEVHFSELRIAWSTRDRCVLVHQTSFWRLPVSREGRGGVLLRGLGLGLAGLAGAVLLKRIALHWERDRLRTPSR